MYMKSPNVDDLCDCLLLFLTPSCRIDQLKLKRKIKNKFKIKHKINQ